MMLTCLRCGQAWHVSAKTKYKANNYICPKCEMHKKSTDGNGNFRTVQTIKISKDSITGSGVNVNSKKIYPRRKP